MPFVTLPGVEGKFYVPAHDPDCLRKHGCSTCFACQMCGDDRCRVCLEAEEGCAQNGCVQHRGNGSTGAAP